MDYNLRLFTSEPISLVSISGLTVLMIRLVAVLYGGLLFYVGLVFYVGFAYASVYFIFW
jgi:hypothetical protein